MAKADAADVDELVAQQIAPGPSRDERPIDSVARRSPFFSRACMRAREAAVSAVSEPEKKAERTRLNRTTTVAVHNTGSGPLRRRACYPILPLDRGGAISPASRKLRTVSPSTFLAMKLGRCRAPGSRHRAPLALSCPATSRRERRPAPLPAGMSRYASWKADAAQMRGDASASCPEHMPQAERTERRRRCQCPTASPWTSRLCRIR